jgi:hypothetical protein
MSRVSGTKDLGLVEGPWNQGPQVGTLSSSSLPSMFIDQVGAQSGLISPQPGFHGVNGPLTRLIPTCARFP